MIGSLWIKMDNFFKNKTFVLAAVAVVIVATVVAASIRGDTIGAIDSILALILKAGFLVDAYI